MRALYLTMGAGIGGGSISLQTLMEELRKYDVASTVVLPEYGPLVDRYERIDIPCHVINFDWLNRQHPLRTITGYRQWRRLLRVIKPDIIHVNALPAARPVAAVAWSMGIPWICHCRFPPEPKYAAWVLRGLPKPHAVLFNSYGLQSASGADLAKAWPHTHQYVVHNGVDMDRFCAVERRRHSPPRIGIIGNLTPVKAHEVFIEMAALLTGESAEAEYWIVGRDKGYEPTLRALVGKHNLESRVKFLGFQEDIPSILAQLDISVCCSHEETFGRCVVEAMAARLPVVATRVGGLPEVVDDGVTGLLVPPRDPVALAVAVRQLLNDEVMCESMGFAGRDRAVSMFGSPAHAKEILHIYSNYSAAVRGTAAGADVSELELQSTYAESAVS